MRYNVFMDKFIMEFMEKDQETRVALFHWISRRLLGPSEVADRVFLETLEYLLFRAESQKVISIEEEYEEHA